jgi:nucleotide-binding universal stress UspA family protein
MPMSWEEYLKYETRRCKEICLTYLNGVKKRLKKEGLNVRLSMPVGTAAQAIIKYIDKNDIDLIVLSTHGHTGIGQWAFGSVSNKVIKGTSTPVLLIRAARS